MDAAMERHHGEASASDIASNLVRGDAERDVRDYAGLLAGGGAQAVEAVHVLEAVAQLEPKLLGPAIPKLVRQLRSEQSEVADVSAGILAQLVRVAPAKVAKQIATMRDSFAEAGPGARDGIVRAFVGLCSASVVYQRRLIDTLTEALRDADLERMKGWAELMLPALKGEPYAVAREVVESRLSDLPRAEGQQACAAIGVSYRGRPTG